MRLPAALRRRRVVLMVVAGLVAGAVALPVGVGAAAPQDVLTDIANDGRVDGQLDPDPAVEIAHHSYSDLQRAKTLIQAQDPANAPPVIAAIQEVIERDYLGISPPGPDSATPAPPSVDIPDWVFAAAVGALLLVVGGVASAIYRRTRRPA